MQPTWTPGRFNITLWVLMNWHACKSLLNTSRRAVEQLAGCLAKPGKSQQSRSKYDRLMRCDCFKMGVSLFTTVTQGHAHSSTHRMRHSACTLTRMPVRSRGGGGTRGYENNESHSFTRKTGAVTQEQPWMRKWTWQPWMRKWNCHRCVTMSRTVRLYYLTDQGVSLAFPELPSVEMDVGKWELGHSWVM